MVNVLCVHCGRTGWIRLKTSRSHDCEYVYFYVDHSPDQPRWCYLGKYESLPEEYKAVLSEQLKERYEQIRAKQQEIPNLLRLFQLFHRKT